MRSIIIRLPVAIQTTTSSSTTTPVAGVHRRPHRVGIDLLGHGVVVDVAAVHGIVVTHRLLPHSGHVHGVSHHGSAHLVAHTHLRSHSHGITHGIPH